MKNCFKKIFISLICIIFAMPAMAQWESMNGPTGKYVRDVKCYDGLIYAATGGGVRVSTDDGASWEFRNNGLLSCDTKSLTQLDDYVYVSTDENVFRTNDGGMNWQPCGTDINGLYCKHVINYKGDLYVATYTTGVFKSSDGGDTWTMVLDANTTSYPYYFACNDSYLFLGTYGKYVYRTADGSSWQQVKTGLPENNGLAVYCFNGTVLCSTMYSGLYLSDDNGETWYQSPSNVSSIKGFADVNGVLYAGSFGQGVYKSTNNGMTWTSISNGLSDKNLWCVGVSENHVFAGATNGKAYVADLNGNGWNANGQHNFMACVGSVAVNNGRFLAGTHGSGFHYSNNGTTWTESSGISTVEQRSMFVSGNNVLDGTDMLGIYLSTNNGQSFSEYNSGLNTQWVNTFTSTENIVLAGSRDHGVFATSQIGNSWTNTTYGMTATDVRCLDYDGTNIFAATRDGGIFRTDSWANSWEYVGNEEIGNYTTAVKSYDGKVFLGTFANGLFVSEDHGTTWTKVLGIAEDTDVRCMSYNENVLAIGCGNGDIYLIYNDLEYHQLVEPKLCETPVLSMYLADDYIYAGINAGGVWRIEIPENHQSIPENIVSKEIYPNPTTGIVNLSMEVIENVRVIDISGRELMNFKNVNSIDITNLENGVYFIEMDEKSYKVIKL